MRELWRAACGRIDLDVMGRAFWLAAFDKDKKLTERELAQMHPLRALEIPPPPPKSADEKAVENKAGWALVRQFFKQKPKRR